MDQIMHFLNQEPLQDEVKREQTLAPPALIDWNHPSKATFECFPESFSHRDRRIAYGFPFYIGLFRNFRRLINPTYKKLMVMRRDRIEQVKKEYLKKCPQGTIISANDLITAGLCQSCHSTDIFSFPLNMRGRKEDMMDQMAAGYLCCEIPFPRTAALEPIGMRQIVSERKFYDTDELPEEPFFQGKNGRVSNFASITSDDMFEKGPSGLEILCNCLPVNFFEIFPIDVCMIFAMDSQHIGVMHNFDKFSENKMLDEMTVFTLQPHAKDEPAKQKPPPLMHSKL
jgi:hypothetical protein